MRIDLYIDFSFQIYFHRWSFSLAVSREIYFLYRIESTTKAKKKGEACIVIGRWIFLKEKKSTKNRLKGGPYVQRERERERGGEGGGNVNNVTTLDAWRTCLYLYLYLWLKIATDAPFFCNSFRPVPALQLSYTLLFLLLACLFALLLCFLRHPYLALGGLKALPQRSQWRYIHRISIYRQMSIGLYLPWRVRARRQPPPHGRPPLFLHRKGRKEIAFLAFSPPSFSFPALFHRKLYMDHRQKWQTSQLRGEREEGAEATRAASQDTWGIATRRAALFYHCPCPTRRRAEKVKLENIVQEERERKGEGGNGQQIQPRKKK